MTRTTLLLVAAVAAVSFAGAGVASAISTRSCPPRDKGVIVEHGGHFVTVCTNVI